MRMDIKTDLTSKFETEGILYILLPFLFTNFFPDCFRHNCIAPSVSQGQINNVGNEADCSAINQGAFFACAGVILYFFCYYLGLVQLCSLVLHSGPGWIIGAPSVRGASQFQFFFAVLWEFEPQQPQSQ